MFDTLQQLAASAFVQRFTLWLNHVLASEEAAMARLRPHAGRSVRVDLSGWPSLLPAPPALSFVVTRAGLLEWTGDQPAAEPDLRLTVDASNPALMVAQGLAGQRPAVDISGDSAFATDLNWLMDNLRWDVEDDLARFIGDAPAHELMRVGRPVGQAMRSAVAMLAGLAVRQGPPER
jgi:ubiquinone biosynthesis accessory factor UbiJ